MKTPPAHTVAKYSQGPSRVQMHPFSLLLSLALCYTNLPALPLAPSKSSKCHPEILQTPSPPNRRHSMCSGRSRTRLERVQTPKNGDRHEDQTVPRIEKSALYCKMRFSKWVMASTHDSGAIPCPPALILTACALLSLQPQAYAGYNLILL